MIKRIYLKCLSHSSLRKPLRRARAKLQSVCGYTDPFYEMAHIADNTGARLFIDIGCHHGDTLLRFLESGLKCPVVAFDPSGENIEKAQSLLRTHPRIGFYQLALSDTDGTARFYLNKNDQTSSLLANDAGNLESFADDTATLGSCEVQTRTLDSWAAEQAVAGPCIIKCDTQGAEGMVIAGGKSFIRDQCVAFYGEIMLGKMYQGQCSFEKMRGLLEEDCGLVLRNIYPCLHDSAGRAVQMDGLWVKPEWLGPRCTDITV